MRSRILAAAVAALSLSLAVPAAAYAAPPFPTEIPLPVGWQPEGIASGNGNQLYVGSIPTGDILQLDARTGAAVRTIDAPTGSAAVGIEVAGNRIWVAGGATGKGFVYDVRTGKQLAALTFVTSGPTFINDVTLTPKKAYFTDSQRSTLFVVDRRTFDVTRLAVDVPLVAGFNLNGIEDARGGRYLLSIQTATGILWRIDSRTGSAVAVNLHGVNLADGDGLLLQGRTLYVVQNVLNRIAVVKLGSDLTSGRLVRTITSREFDVPTTVARIGNRLYLPNARFGIPSPGTADYAVTEVRR
jgi:sugar lactone lactonase YvrE